MTVLRLFLLKDAHSLLMSFRHSLVDPPLKSFMASIYDNQQLKVAFEPWQLENPEKLKIHAGQWRDAHIFCRTVSVNVLKIWILFTQLLNALFFIYIFFIGRDTIVLIS